MIVVLLFCVLFVGFGWLLGFVGVIEYAVGDGVALWFVF